jgi:N-acetyl-gamma-glutamyl-phosphate reductase
MIREKHPIFIVGARGYSGLELARVLLKHSEVQLKGCFATDSNWALSDYLSNEAAQSVSVHSMQALETQIALLGGAPSTVFLATPADVSMTLAPQLLALGANVIDLSGAFRLDPASFKHWYGETHTAPEWTERASYGLVPWSAPAQGRPVLISNPGCYATSVLMALIPLLKAGVLKPESIVIDAKSGTTGAGRKASENLLFTEVDGECLPYRVARHQHLPEINAYLGKFSGVVTDVAFATHLLPTRRGILSSIYARLARETSAADIDAIYAQAYGEYPLVRFGRAEPKLMSLKRVVGTARNHISYELDGGRIFVFSTIDNLLKGAASQAIENLNRVLDLPVTTGLTELEELT